jgi:hypothetical protein
MGTPVGRSGDMFVYTDRSGKRAVKPIVGDLSLRHTSNSSPVLSSGTAVKLDSGTVVLGADLGSRFTANGNPVKDLHSRAGMVSSDLSTGYRVS